MSSEKNQETHFFGVLCTHLSRNKEKVEKMCAEYTEEYGTLHSLLTSCMANQVTSTVQVFLYYHDNVHVHCMLLYIYIYMKGNILLFFFLVSFSPQSYQIPKLGNAFLCCLSQFNIFDCVKVF